MRLGLVTPIVTRHPQHDAAWTEDTRHRSLVHYLEQLEAIASDVMPLVA